MLNDSRSTTYLGGRRENPRDKFGLPLQITFAYTFDLLSIAKTLSCA
jgi:hypothetical protein